jgi:DNA (cytosine-5)-methyltransferase 1
VEAVSSDLSRVLDVKKFVETATAPEQTTLSAVSAFTGAGLGDFGYRLAGFGFRLQVERDERRLVVGQPNFPGSEWAAEELPVATPKVIKQARRALGAARLDLLIVTPPCQGMSSSNPSRGKRHSPDSAAHDDRNRLILEAIPLALALNPRVLVCENVRPVVTLPVTWAGRSGSILEMLRAGLPDYEVFHGVIDAADYGIAQTRRRALVVAVSRSEPWLATLVSAGLLPWPRATHAQTPQTGLEKWVTVSDWFSAMAYQSLDAVDREKATGDHELHYVPSYGADRYLQVSSIPPNSGLSAYDNDVCPECGGRNVPAGLVQCPECHGLMRNRPYCIRDGAPRLIKGFHSSYRRMKADRPAPTVTTNTSHVGSDFKIHPWENRVLSTLECADLQSVPRSYDWSGALSRQRRYLVRNLVGEALPTYFAHQHGRLLRDLIEGREVALEAFAESARSTPARAMGIPISPRS